MEDIDASRVFTPRILQMKKNRLQKTTEDYVKNEVLPVVEKLENHEFEHSVQLNLRET